MQIYHWMQFSIGVVQSVSRIPSTDNGTAACSAPQRALQSPSSPFQPSSLAPPLGYLHSGSLPSVASQQNRRRNTEYQAIDLPAPLNSPPLEACCSKQRLSLRRRKEAAGHKRWDGGVEGREGLLPAHWKATGSVSGNDKPSAFTLILRTLSDDILQEPPAARHRFPSGFIRNKIAMDIK